MMKMKTYFVRVISLLLVFVSLGQTAFAGNEYAPACDASYTSLVDGLNSVGEDSSFDHRADLAVINAIVDDKTAYCGSADQNNQLLSLLREGNLRVAISPEDDTSAHTSDKVIYTGSVGGYADAITVTKDAAPLRYEADGSKKIQYRAEKGAVLPNLGIKHTGLFGCNKWYITSFNGEELYIFAGNAEIHNHNYKSYSVYGVDFNVCDCGHVTFTTYEKVRVKQAECFAGLATAATASALADGPLPIGEIVGAVILGVGTIYLTTSNTASLETAKEIATDVDYVEYLKKQNGICGPTSYRMVARTSPNLTFISDSCLSLGEAYVYVRYCQGDVWCQNSIVAGTLAELNYSGSYYEHDKDQVTHYMHYHLGKDADHKVGGHIFYGTNELGQTPST